MTTDLDVLEALAKAAALDEWWSAEELGEALTEFNGRVEEVDAAEFIAAADPPAVLALIAELRQERERADEAIREMHARELHHFEEEKRSADLEAALSRAEEIITRALDVRLRMDEMPPREAWPQYKDDIRAVLTEYDKQKGADRG